MENVNDDHGAYYLFEKMSKKLFPEFVIPSFIILFYIFK